MTQKLAEKHLDALVPTNEDQQIPNWQDWVLAETIRRTVFVVNIINVLSLRMGHQNIFFYKPLDDDLVSDMPLPAPDSWWRAQNAGNRTQPSVSHHNRMTLGELRDKSMSDPQTDCSFTRLILATCRLESVHKDSDTSS